MRAPKKMRSPSVTKYYISLFKIIVSLLMLIVTYQFQGQNITSFEYYFGTDPGFGNGTAISANANTGEITQDLIIPVTGLNEGFHRLYIRALDDNGTWSLFDASNFYILDNTVGPVPVSNLDDAEYWFDADPGFGNGTPLTFTGNPSEATESYVIPLGTLDEGFHTLRIRAKNLDGTWGLYTRSNFYIVDNTVGPIPISDIAALEYWFGTDPGFGNGTPLTFSGNPSELTESFVIPVAGLNEGFETITIRAQNLDGTWSLYDKRTFYISDIPGSDPISNLQKIEYWIDLDPGFGNATEIDIPGAPSDYSEPLVIPIGLLDGGFHEIGIRAQNLDGTWSLYEKRQFFVFDNDDFITPPAAPIEEIEYLYDAELGFGTGIPLAFSPTGNPNEYLIEIPTNLVTCDIHDIWISMKDTNGNYSLYQILENVDVFDNQDPTIVVFPDITVELDASGQGSLTIADVDNGTFDDCELVSVVLNQAQFDYTCADLGANTVTITATDAENKVSTQDVTITVVDNIDPVAVAQDITLTLDASGSATITGDDLDFGSTDNCSIVTKVVDISSFDCTNLGANTVNFTVTDPDGNTDTVSVTVTVQDSTEPTVLTQDLTVQLDASGSVTITVDDIDDSSTDNCTISTRVLDIDTFDCTDLGVNTVALTVTDQSGNNSTATATVTVEDNINPIAVAQDITIQLDASGNATIVPGDVDNGSSDNCSIASSSLDVTSFDCSSLGANTVTLTVTDTSGNIDTTTATVTVEDSVNPVAIGQDITVQLDASGNATITSTDIDNNSSDNCAIDTRVLDITSFDCSNVGANTVTLTVTDTSGNSNATTVTVTVEDSEDPTVVTQNISVQLDASGTASIVAADVESSVSDNCGIASSVIDVSSFDCNDLGPNPINLTVTDNNGNVTITPATVTVEDAIDPIAIAQDITLQLDDNGAASLITSDVENGSSDNCSIASSSLDITSFDCTNIGANTVTYTVSDPSGNTDTAIITVTIEDTTAPVAIAQDITVDLDASGNATITAADIDISTDNCLIDTSTIDISSFDCSNIGSNTVTLTVTDGSGNSDITTATVTVQDNLNPTAIGQDITIDLLGMPSVSIVAADLDNGSGDNCSGITLSIDVDTFTEEGVFPVVLTVTDSSGNTSTVTVNVTVTDSLSIDDVEYSPKDIILYPNPASDRLYFETDLIISKMQIVDLTGKVILERLNPEEYVTVESFEEGVYFILFNIDGIKVTKRFIKK